MGLSGVVLALDRRLAPFSLGHFQVGNYRYRSLIEGLYTL